MQQVKVEMVCPKARETPLASPFNSVPCHMRRPHFGNQEYLFTPTRNDAADQLLRLAVSINLRRINQSHAQRNAFAQRVFFDRCGVSSLTQTRRALTKRWDDGSVVKISLFAQTHLERCQGPLPLMAR